jgi:hypothetical protein
MEITIRHVLDVSPRLAELLGRLLAGVAVDGRQAGVGRPENDGAPGPHPAEPWLPPAPAPQAESAPADHIADAGNIVPAESPARVPGAWRTEARRDVLLELYPQGVALAQMYAALAEVPGPPMPPERYHVTHWARDMKLRRPGDGAEPWRTPERRAILAEAWPAGVPAAEIGARMRALPGGEVLDSRISVWAAQLKLVRPDWYKAALADERTARIRDTRWVKAPGEAPEPVVDAAEPAVAVAEPVPAPAVVSRPAVTMHIWPPSAARKPPALPPAGEDGLVRASFREIREWAAFYGIRYDGGNVDQVNRRRAGMGLPAVAQCEARTLAERAA